MNDLKSFNNAITNTKTQDYLSQVLGSRKEQFVTNLISLVANDSKLQQCEPYTLMYSAMKATALNLPVDPNLGYAAILPYWSSKEKKFLAQFQIMRNGWIELLQRTGQLKSIVNEIVHEGELVSKNKFTGEYIFDEDKRVSNKVIGYMAYIKLINGFEKTIYWTVDECKAHAAKYSKTYADNKGLWIENFDAMALKTVLKHLINKYMPKSAQLNDAIQSDQAVIGESLQPTAYIDNVATVEATTIDAPAPESYDDLVEEKKEAMRQAQAGGSSSAPVMP